MTPSAHSNGDKHFCMIGEAGDGSYNHRQSAECEKDDRPDHHGDTESGLGGRVGGDLIDGKRRGSGSCLRGIAGGRILRDAEGFGATLVAKFHVVFQCRSAFDAVFHITIPFAVFVIVAYNKTIAKENV